jgi:hypothetical protein
VPGGGPLLKRGDSGRRATLAGVGVGLVSFVLYLLTLAPTVLPLQIPQLPDSDMLQMQVCVLGIAHPTGYPTYVMLSHLFTYLPFGDCAYRVNLASAVYAALAVSAVYAAGFLLTRRIVAALAGALALGLGTTFWSQAVIAEVYTLNALFVALVIIALLLWRDTRRDRYLLLAAFGVGLAMTNHMTSGLLLPAGFLFVAVVSWHKLLEWKLVLKGAGLFLLGLAPYLYLPIRSLYGAPMVANKPDNLERFLYVVSGGNLREQFFAFGVDELPDRLLLYAHHLLENFNWGLVVLGAMGVGAMILWDRAAALFTGTLFLGWGFHAIENNIPDVALYFIPTYLVLALWISAGVGTLLEESGALIARFSRHPRPAATATLTLLPAALLLLPLAGARESYANNDLSEDYRAQQINDTVAENTAPNATVIHMRSSLWYMVLVEKRRQDLTLVDPLQGYESGAYKHVVWPDEVDHEEMYSRYGTDDNTGVKTATMLAENGPVYVLAHPGLNGAPFYEAGFGTIQVGETHPQGTLFKLVPPDDLPNARS